MADGEINATISNDTPITIGLEENNTTISLENEQPISLNVSNEDNISVNITDNDNILIDIEGNSPSPTNFIDLVDVPHSYVGQATKTIKVKDTEDGLEFTNVEIDWGEIGGTLSDQTDLQSALDLKVDDTDLANYVPYTGATGDVNLGTHNITAANLTGTNTGDQDLSYYLENKKGKSMDYQIQTSDTSYYHSSIMVENYLYLGTRTVPATISKVNREDLSDFSTITLSTGNNNAESVTYNELDGFLYFLCSNSKIIKFNPTTMAYTVHSYPTVDSGSSGGITNDGTHLYFICNSLSPKTAKILMSDMSLVTSVVNGLYNGHALVYDSETGYLFGTSTTGSIEKINPINLAVVTSTSVFRILSDDIALSPDYLWCVSENNPSIIYRISKIDLSILEIPTGITVAGFGCVYCGIDNCIYVIFNEDSTVIKIDTETLKMSIYQDTSQDGVNEIVSDGYRIFLTTWTSPAKIIRIGNPIFTEFRWHNSDGSEGMRYTEGTLTADYLVGNGSGITNIPVGNTGDIQFKGTTVNLDYDGDFNYDKPTKNVELGNYRCLLINSKIGVFL